MTVVAWIGAATALLAGTVALVQPDIKRVLAYSTVSQLGYMFMALGVGAYSAAIFLVIAHAFFKATLFLGAGTVIHGNGDNQDMRIMGGFRKYMPYTAGAFVVAWLAISGLPPFSGFFAKDGVLEKVYEHSDYGLWAVGLVAAILTGAYMTRQVLLTFFGNERWRAGEGAEHADEATHDVTATPTVGYGEPPRAPSLHHEPHEGSGVDGRPGARAGGAGHRRRVAQRAAEGHGVPRQVAGAGVRRRQADPRAVVHRGLGLSAAAVLFGLGGLAVACVLYRRGLASPERDPFDERLGVLGRVFGHAYYYDETISRGRRPRARRGRVDGPGVRRRDHRRCGQRRRPRRTRHRPRLAPAPDRPGAQLRAGRRARHRRPARVPARVGGPDA